MGISTPSPEEVDEVGKGDSIPVLECDTEGEMVEYFCVDVRLEVLGIGSVDEYGSSIDVGGV
jgi:hypothetical protein